MGGLEKSNSLTFKHDQHGRETLFQHSLVHQLRLVGEHYLRTYTSYREVYSFQARSGRSRDRTRKGGDSCSLTLT